MKSAIPTSKICKECGQLKPVADFLFHQKIIDLCKNCREPASGDDSEGGGGRNLHKDYYSEYNPEGEKGAKNVAREEHAIEQRKGLEETKLEQKTKEPLKTSFLNRVRTTIFSKNEALSPMQTVNEDSLDFLKAANYLSNEILFANPQVINPSFLRSKTIQHQWNLKTAWQHKTFKGPTLTENLSKKTPPSAEQYGLSENDPAVEIIKSWRPK